MKLFETQPKMYFAPDEATLSLGDEVMEGLEEPVVDIIEVLGDVANAETEIALDEDYDERPLQEDDRVDPVDEVIIDQSRGEDVIDPEDASKKSKKDATEDYKYQMSSKQSDILDDLSAEALAAYSKSNKPVAKQKSYARAKTQGIIEIETGVAMSRIIGSEREKPLSESAQQALGVILRVCDAAMPQAFSNLSREDRIKINLQIDKLETFNTIPPSKLTDPRVLAYVLAGARSIKTKLEQHQPKNTNQTFFA